MNVIKKLVYKAKKGRHFGKNFAHWVIKSQPDTFLRLDCIVPKKKGENTGTSDLGKSVGLPILELLKSFRPMIQPFFSYI